MQFEARIAPLDAKLPKVSYRWDPETDILSVACKGVSKATGMNGTVDLEGADGSFVVLDVAGGTLRGLDVVTWPDDISTVDTLPVPDAPTEGRVVFPSRRSQWRRTRRNPCSTSAWAGSARRPPCASPITSSWTSTGSRAWRGCGCSRCRRSPTWRRPPSRGRAAAALRRAAVRR